MKACQIRTGDCRTILPTLPDKSIHCVVTSPPYWGLRSYKGDPGMIGLEPTFDEHLSNLFAVFREVWRVLRDDGTLWLNYGDAYARGDNRGGSGSGDKQASNAGSAGVVPRAVPGLKTKDLMLMPADVARALRSDGWYLRSKIIWAKPNPMPESVTDRPTSSYEELFLLTKSARYFYDAEAVRVPLAKSSLSQYQQPYTGDQGKDYVGSGVQDGRDIKRRMTDKQRGHGRRHAGFNDRWDAMSQDEQQANGANLRNVWTIATHSFKEAHFATFPPKLVEPCIKAGTSERGVCGECGAPWKRKIVTTGHVNKREPAHVPGNTLTKVDSTGWKPTTEGTNQWAPTCEHKAATVPATVLDPFAGSGTVGAVALAHNRRFIGIEINGEYTDMARRRVLGPLFAEAGEE